MPKYTLGGDPPQSRAEKILMSQDSGPAQSRLEELLKNGAGGGVTPEQIVAAVAAYLDEHGVSITVDSALSGTSENPVQNKVVKTALDTKGTYSKPDNGIPASDLSSDVQTLLGKADTALQQHQSLNAYQTKAITDTGGYFSADTVEGALQEIGVELGNQSGSVPRVAMASTDTTPTLDPNKLYVFPEMASLALRAECGSGICGSTTRPGRSCSRRVICLWSRPSRPRRTRSTTLFRTGQSRMARSSRVGRLRKFRMMIFISLSMTAKTPGLRMSILPAG